MTEPTSSANTLSNAWEVLVLFLIPVGGGIPGGVLLAKSRGLAWPVMTVLYFISDVILALVFEPIMMLFIAGSRRNAFLARVGAAFKQSTNKTLALYGKNLGPFALVLISFGVDPMTGRAAAVAAGHGFVTGWLIAITGDLFYFALIMASTLWLSEIFGDGTWVTLMILAVMTIVPMFWRKFRARRLSD